MITRRVHHMVVQRSVTIPTGVYRFYDWNFSFNTNPARRFHERFT